MSDSASCPDDDSLPSTPGEWDFQEHLQQQLTARQRARDRNPNVERVWTSRQIKSAFIETFELIGGVPRLAIWANQNDANYLQFLKLVAVIAPKETLNTDTGGGKVIEYRSNVPHSPLSDRFLERGASDGELVDE